MQYPTLIEVQPQDNFILKLQFDNGQTKYYDFKPNFSHPYYKQLESKILFEQLDVHDGLLEWKTGHDFCPHTLYERSITLLNCVMV